MKHKKWMLIILSLLTIMALLAACGPAEEAEEPADEEMAEEEMYIPVISKGFQHAFWLAVEKGAEQAAEEYGVEITFEGPETEAMVDKQMDMLQAAIDKNPAAICFAAVDSKAAIPLLEQAQEKGIPVIGFDSGVDSDIPLATAATDNVAAAALAADKMVELIGGSGQVAVIAHDNTSRTGIDRVAGFKERIESEYPDVEIVDIQYGGGDHLKSTDLAKAIIQANPDLKGFFGANEGSIIGVLNAATELGREDLVIIGYDSGQQQLEAIRSGLEAGAITQNPIGIGYECVKAAYMAAKGETLEKEIDTGFMWFDANNIDDPEIQAVLYE
jgi:ribose transport system substrate-binding protein